MDVTFRDYDPADADWIVARHQAHYAEAEGFDDSFGALVAKVLARFEATRDPARERGWIAVDADGARRGSIFCMTRDDDTAQLRLFLLDPALRGHGVGQRMLDAFTIWARSRGYRRAVLWTHESHRAACALYARSGWTCRSSTPVTSFGRPLVEQHWDIVL
ncbi:acetyltransferase [Roseivivax marinus]|uniref:Acetyltransferase n=1 Tax=Roseivivax marinus TaxID=1379903 RepID=W4HHY8_9RHOB|nr:GNAT family N-acetyltransferase [Roseivivax marinus]ETW12013.1 acetyltransferase [Roseivivax marinus]